MTYYKKIQNGSDDDFLKHYGIKGMKWGVRRSPDQLGSSRVSKLKNKAKSFGRKTANDPDSPETAKKKELRAKVKANRSTDSLTNAELQHVIQRMNLEKQYAMLNQPQAIKIMNGGKDFAQSIVKETVKSTVSKQLKDQINAKLASEADSKKK